MSGLEQGWGLMVILWFQSWRTELIGAIAMGFHYMGGEDFFMALLALVYWCVDTAFARRMTVLFVIQAWFYTMLKEVFQRPRPFQVSDQVDELVVENTPGLPSGHAQTAAAIGGALALRVRRNWFTILMVVYAILMALSRMILGVHYPQDVIAGLALGLLVLAAYAWLEPRISAWLDGQSMWAQIGIAAAAGTALMIIHPLLIPAQSPEDAEYALSSGSVLIGGGIGFALEKRFVRFSDKGAWWQLLVRFALGFALLMGIRIGLREAFATLEPVWLFRVIRYTVLGLTVGWLAPWLFVKLRLAAVRPS